MGTRGPIPKAPGTRLGHVAKTEKKPTPAVTVNFATVPVPDAPAGLHAIALNWYESLSRSAQSQFYEESDWATAQVVAVAMSKCLRARTMSGMMFASVMSAQAELLTTEGSRRRARLQIQREVEAKAAPGVSKMADFRKKAQ